MTASHTDQTSRCLDSTASESQYWACFNQGRAIDHSLLMECEKSYDLIQKILRIPYAQSLSGRLGRLFQFRLLQFLSFRHHVGRNLLEPERGRAMGAGAGETYACLRNFSKIFNGFRDHALSFPTSKIVRTSYQKGEEDAPGSRCFRSKPWPRWPALCRHTLVLGRQGSASR